MERDIYLVRNFTVTPNEIAERKRYTWTTTLSNPSFLNWGLQILSLTKYLSNGNRARLGWGFPGMKNNNFSAFGFYEY